jgi:hypothetical protein
VLPPNKRLKLSAHFRAMGYTCITCGAYHDERPTCWKFDAPAAVGDLSDAEVAARVDQGSDQCVLDGEHFFILGNLDVPIRGSDEFLRWSVWSTLSRENFERAVELWEAPGRENEPPYFSWLSNQIPGYPASVSIKALVHTASVGLRFRIEVLEEGHQLRADQRNGITAERADELIHAAIVRSAA